MGGPHELEVVRDAEAAARRAAEVVAEGARSAVEERGAFALAVSGGRSAPVMFAELSATGLPLVLAADPSIPAGRVRAARRLVLVDRAAASTLT